MWSFSLVLYKRTLQAIILASGFKQETTKSVGIYFVLFFGGESLDLHFLDIQMFWKQK